MTTSVLIQHALSNVWCTPDQDKQFIFKPARISKPLGVKGNLRVLQKTVALPDNFSKFHVYQIGQIFPSIMNLLPLRLEWVNFCDCCNTQKMILDVYDANGIRYPNHLVWYKFTMDRNLIIAIAVNKKIPINLSTDDVFIRMYSNAYFSSTRSDQINDIIKNEGKSFDSLNEIVSYQNDLITYQNRSGHLSTYVNGYLTNGINPFTTKVGDVVEILFDSSIYKVKELNIRDMDTFDSILDSRRKYLVHYPEDTDNLIEYYDDVDFYLYKQYSNNTTKGVYYHHNKVDSVRMVTHRDYSIQVPYVVSFNDHIPDSPNYEDLVLKVLVRKSGYNRGLVFDNNRLFELYKLPDAQVKSALLGIDSTVNNWRADVLEQSSYSKIMYSDDSQITDSLVEEAYGYNAISKIIGDNPIAPTNINGAIAINLPHAYKNDSTVFEYDINGHLLGYDGHSVGDVFVCRHLNTKLMEVFAGRLSNHFDEITSASFTINPLLNYRFYASPIVNGVKKNEWADVTGSAKYSIQNGVATWLVSTSNFEYFVRTDKNLVCINESVIPYDGVINFPLYQVTTAKKELFIPPGEIYIFLNNRPIIEGLDYYMDFPNFVITNKEYLVGDPLTTAQEVLVVMKGLCNNNLEYESLNEHGFVMYGMLSKNNKFDIRDDKVLRMVIDGKVVPRSTLSFAEDHSSVYVGNVTNGKPYSIKDTVVPTKGLTIRDTYVLRAESETIDKRVSDYLSLKIPEAPRSDVFSITDLYRVFSPLCCKIIYDLKAGRLQDDRIYGNLTDSIALEIYQQYNWLTPFDPCTDANYPDNRFVIIHPHNLNTVISVDAFQYRLISIIVRLVLKNRVNLSSFLQISS